jgi:transcriptional regulator of acetoin/glycerol metabolism
VSSDDNTTQRLDPTEPAAERRSTLVLRWCSRTALPFTRLDKNRISLGRSSSSDVVLDVSGVSRDHAIITRQGPVYALADAGSTNGTYLNGERIQHAALAPNDVVRLGDLVGVVVWMKSDADPSNDLVVIDDALFGPGLRHVLDALRKAAPTRLPLIVVGETGTGKEVIARTLHAQSGRTGPFHAVNCAALPPSLAEAELFGYRRGAFTGAEQAAVGHLRSAHGGTLLLDELADLALPVQAKLLRALQNSEVTPLGEARSVSVDLRVVAACQKQPSELVQSGQLREDLVMRLSGLTLTLPPLRERRVDIALLCDHFVARFAGQPAPEVEARALERLLLYRWPGNVRELELGLQSLFTLHAGEPVLRRTMLSQVIRGDTGASTPPPRDDASPRLTRKEHDLSALLQELKKNGGNVAAAASTIGISRQRAYRVMAGKTVEELLESAGLGDGEPRE